MPDQPLYVAGVSKKIAEFRENKIKYFQIEVLVSQNELNYGFYEDII